MGVAAWWCGGEHACCPGSSCHCQNNCIQSRLLLCALGPGWQEGVA